LHKLKRTSIRMTYMHVSDILLTTTDLWKITNSNKHWFTEIYRNVWFQCSRNDLPLVGQYRARQMSERIAEFRCSTQQHRTTLFGSWLSHSQSLITKAITSAGSPKRNSDRDANLSSSRPPSPTEVWYSLTKEPKYWRYNWLGGKAGTTADSLQSTESMTSHNKVIIEQSPR
jgi:hypothetical protein